MKPVITRYVIPGGALVLAFVVSGVVVFTVAGLVVGDSDDDDSAPGQAALGTITAATTRPPGTLAAAPTASATMQPATPTATPALRLAPSSAPAATPQPTPPLPPTPASFAGTWRIVDTVVQGAGAGQTFTFQVTLTQSGATLQGGAPGAITLSGTVAGNIATAQFTQPGLNLTGIFIWTLNADGNATGTFTSSVPNSGTSQLIRTR